jgi:integrase
MVAIDKPRKPYPMFPLTPHSSGKWAKKVRGRIYYFGKWDDPDGALREWNAVKDALLSGRSPNFTGVSPTLKDLLNEYMDRQIVRVDSGKLEARTFVDSKNALTHFARAVGPDRLAAGLRPPDFKLARSSYASDERGPHTINRYIANVKAALNWAVRNGKIPPPVVYGDEFRKEEPKVMRKSARLAKYAKGSEIFSPKEVQAILKLATAPIKAMILLGLNAGFYAVDVACLPKDALNLDDAWLEYPRKKTEVMRAAHLWPETVEALREAAAHRGYPRNRADDGLVFIHPLGNPWVYVSTKREEGTISKATRTDYINKKMLRILKDAGIRRPGVNFAALRDTFSTVAAEVPDENARKLIEGHSFPGMDAFYVKEVARERLEKVVNHVRQKLLNPKVIRSGATKKTPNRKTRRK